MEKDLIIDVNSKEVSIALLENGKLIELDKEANQGKGFSVGDVYLGKVKKIIPSLNAAFVDIGDEKEAFVHYLDLGLNFTSFDKFVKQLPSPTDYKEVFEKISVDEILPKEGRIADYLTVGQPIITQIVKEPISTKGSRLTAEISIAGRNVVLLPFSNKISISQKIKSKDERKRLERLICSILPHNYGVIMRTAAEGKKAAVLDAELKSLIKKWESSWSKISKDGEVSLLFSENSRTTTILRDLLNDSFSNIFVNDETICEEIHDYITTITPELDKIVHFYKGNEPIFDHFNVTKQIKSSFGKVVSIKKGAYLVIEHTEALHVIDVNSGVRIKQREQEENTLEVNMNAAEEIARQMRLRDMGGIIIVDFIDMEDPEHRNQLCKRMQELMSSDRAKHTVLPLTKFGLMQITRQRVRPVTEIDTTEVCPTCKGTGKISSSILIDDVLQRELVFYIKEQGIKEFILKTNPILKAYLTKGIFSICRKWCYKYRCKIKVISSTDFSILQTVWYDKSGEPLSSFSE